MVSSESDRIGIPFPDHSAEVLCALNVQRREGSLCDVVLAVGEREYRAHRAVLAACSQYFKKLFTAQSGDSWHSIYEIDFVEAEPLAAILEFVYTSTLTVTSCNIREVLSAAQMLDIPCIVSVCLEIMDSVAGVAEEEDIQSEGGPGAEDGRVEEEESREDGEYPGEESTAVAEEQACDDVGQVQDSPPSTTPSEGLSDDSQEPASTAMAGDENMDPKGPEVRAIRDFSIEALLQEGLYPKLSATDRTPLFPGFFPPLWNPEFPGFPPIADHSPQLPPYPQEIECPPLNLAVKKEAVKEEMQEDILPSLFHNDFLKHFMGAGLNMADSNHLGSIKDEADLSSYLSFLSTSPLGAFLPPWQLVEDRKMKPKASQQCPICNKVIQGAGKLPRHMRTHTGEKPYVCTICEVRFTRQDKLKIHMRKHTGERPYICLHCNSKFVHNYDLKNHLRIHTGVRPYQCEHCTKSFTRSDHLHRHVKRQSCRLARPRRGRRPTPRQPSHPLYLPMAPHKESGCLTVSDGFFSASPGFVGPRHIISRGNVALENLDNTERRSLEPRLLDRNQDGGDQRRRGVFSFTMTHEGALSSQPLYPSWAMRLDHSRPPPQVTT
ncbi:zinc finger and BTB domain-containing protein 7C-like [Arapaima gigas]